MPLPRSFTDEGFVSINNVRPKRRLMVGTDGAWDTGKTEFGMSCPGPGIIIALDRNYDGVLDNATPPASRKADQFAFRTIPCPVSTQYSDIKVYQKYWQDFYEIYMKALKNKDARTVILDGDSDSWELQRLAEFGRTAKVPQIMYDQINAARRAMINRAHESGKIFFATNKVTKGWEDEIDPHTGQPVTDDKGKVKRRQSGEYVRQGFSDQDYLWNIQIRHMFQPATDGNGTGKAREKRWGIKIMKCKVNKDLEGYELWGDDCCFDALVQTVYPNVPLKEWY